VLRSVVFQAARVFGFVPPGKQWVGRLQSLNGEFHRSAFRSAYLVAVSVLGVFGGVLIGFGELRSVHGLQEPNPVLIALSIILIALGTFLPLRLGVRYVFNHGALSCISASGRLKWREDLRDLKYVTCSSFRGSTSMTLVWEGRRRRIEVYDSLWRALTHE
jgi:hypothetical protein